MAVYQVKEVKMNLRPLTAEQVTVLFTLEELTALGETPNGEMFGRILTKAVVAQRDQDEGIMSRLYEALKKARIHLEILHRGSLPSLGKSALLVEVEQALAEVEK